MTDQQTDDVYALPDRPTLDAESAAAYAVMTELDRQLAGQDIALAINPQPLAHAALAAIGDFPRIPEWTGDPRSIGGGRRPGDSHPAPLMQVRPVEPDTLAFAELGAGYVEFVVEVDGEGRTASDRARVPVEDAEQWALAVLAACRAAGRAPGHPRT